MDELKQLSNHLIFLLDKKLISPNDSELKMIYSVHNGEFETAMNMSDLLFTTQKAMIEATKETFKNLLSTALDFEDIY